MTEKIYIKSCTWCGGTRQTKDTNKKLKVMYSDNTYEILEYEIPIVETYHYEINKWCPEVVVYRDGRNQVVNNYRNIYHTFKEYFDVRTISKKRMTKRQAYNYLNKKFNGWRALCDEFVLNK